MPQLKVYTTAFLGIGGTTDPSATALNDLSDVDASAPSDGQNLEYDSGSGNWESKTPSHIPEVKYRTLAKTFYIHDVATTDDFPMFFVPKAITVTSITGVTVPSSGTIADFNLERRPRYTPNSGGTDLMSSDLTADDTGEEQTSFVSDGAVAARQWIVPAFSGTPTAAKLWIVMEYTID